MWLYHGGQRLQSALLLFLLCLVLGLTACQPSSDPHTLVFAVAQAPVTLDPRYATDAASERVNHLLYQRLVEFDAASRAVPGLATWQMPDAQHLVATLNVQSVQHPVFHHGKPLTAYDVKATYDSLLALADSPHRAEFAHIAAITTPDAQTVIFSLSKPDPHFAERLIIGILPADLIAQGHDFKQQPVGSGAFRFKQWGNALLLQRMADGLQVRVEEVKDPNVRVLKLKRGEVDLLQGDLPPELVSYLQRQQGIQVDTAPGANFSYLGLNTRADFLKDVRVRQAIAYAIDTQAIIRQVLVPHSRQAGAILPPEHYAGNATLPAYAYNPAKARQLLKASGVQLPLTLVYKTSTDAQRVRLATILQAQMQAAGIQLLIKSLDWGTFFADVQHGNFQLYGLTWVGIQTPEIYQKAFGSDSLPPQGFNRGGYQDAVLDDLLAKEDWPGVTRRVHQQLPYIPLWYEGQFAASRLRVQHYHATADGNWDGLLQVQLSPAR